MEEKSFQGDTKKLGIFAEGIARRYLLKRGYEILAANYKMGFGELDIVARKNGVVSFIEVKANRRPFEGLEPEKRVDQRKRNKLIKLGTAYMSRYARSREARLDKNLPESPWQIDIVSITFNFENKRAKIKHFKNAFNDY